MRITKEKTIKVFISSTFKDFHAERDRLARFVFPELKERCRKHRVNLIDVDLRWGVTEKDAQDGRALDICLDEIDSCRPYFLGLLGHRYGCTPQGHGHSITAQEIYHGVLHNEVPRQIVDLRRIIEGKLEGKALSNEQKNTLVKCYPLDVVKRKYVLTDQTAGEDLRIIRSVFKAFNTYQQERSFFFFRSESLTNELAGRNKEDFFEKEKKDRDKLSDLKQDIKNEKLWWTEYDRIEIRDDNDLIAFEKQVKDVLWQHIENEIKIPETAEDIDWLKEEAEFHEIFMADRTRRFVGRQDLLDRMHDLCKQEGESNVLVITGEPGSGKSALMARFTEEVIHRNPGWQIFPHFIGASPTSTSLRQTLRRICAIFNKFLDESIEIPEDINEIKKVFPELLEKVPKHQKVLLILDAVNQFEKLDNAHSMLWLPQQFPKNVSFIISTLPGEAHDALMKRRIKPQEELVKGLTESEIRELVKSYLKEIRHEFPNKQVESDFFNKVKKGNPLYILVALEELRIVGDFEELPIKISKLPDNVPDLFNQVLERIEEDFNRGLVEDCMSYIACGKQGMTSEEMQSLLKKHSPQQPSEKLPDMLWSRLYRAFCSYLFERSGVIDFFHGQLKEAVGKRYLEKEEARKICHQKIADYFESSWQEPYLRALAELPHQLLKAENWENLTNVLCNLDFVQAKSAAKLTFDLVIDYNLALEHLPEAQPECEKERRQQVRMEKYTRDLIAYAQGEIEELDIPESIIPRSKKQINDEIERIKIDPNKADRLKGFRNFLGHEAKNLQDYALEFPHFATQQAWNYANDGPVGKAAESGPPDIRHSLLLLSQSTRPSWNPKPQALQTLKGHTSWIEAISITPDGRRAVSGSNDKTCILWDLQTGDQLQTLKGHTSFINAISITPDGKKVISGSGDKTCILWDLETGDQLQILKGHTSGVRAISITPDGKRAISGSLDNTCILWDLQTGDQLQILKGHTNRVTAISITPDSKRAISGSEDRTCILWDLETGDQLQTLKGHTRYVLAVSITPDGKRAISGSWDDTCILWDLETGDQLQILKGHTRKVFAISITPDGKRAISGSEDKTCILWDLETGDQLQTLKEHTSYIKAISITPDSKRAISGSGNDTCILWDLETGDQLQTLKGHIKYLEAISITPDSKRAIAGSVDKTCILWDLETGDQIQTFEGHTHWIHDISITPDGKRVISGSQDKTCILWDLQTGANLQTLIGHTSGVEAIAITPDGKRAITGSGGNACILWDLETGDQLQTLEGQTSWFRAIAITPDGKRAITGSNDDPCILWDLQTGDQLQILKGHTRPVEAISITPDGKRALSGSWDNTCILWNLQSGDQLQTLKGHTKNVWAISITPDGRRAVSGSADKTCILWDLDSGEKLAMAAVTSVIMTIELFPGGILGGSGSDEFFVFNTKKELLSPGIGIVTVRQIWDFEFKRFIPFTADCPFCGHRFAPENKIIDTIKSLLYNSHIGPADSPCLKLPKEAWEEPELFSNCPKCSEALQFNPFLAGGE